MLSNLFSFISVLSLAAAAPSALEARATCTFTNVQQLASGKASCTNIVLNGIAVPAGQTLDLTALQDGTHITFQGTTSFGYKEWTGPLMSISGNHLTVTGAKGHNINGNGKAWWDGKGSNGGKVKPKMWAIHKTQNSVFTNLHITNTPVQCFSIDDAQNVSLTSITIDDSAGDAAGGHNTDAFDIGSSSDITITGANVHNQYDCLAINSGSNITFTGGTCIGGHGLSIGSVGGRDDNTVSDVYITSSSVSRSENGVRVKTVSGATGSVSNVHFENIAIADISDYGVVVQQNYENGKPDGMLTSGVQIAGLVLRNVTGSMDQGAEEVSIACGQGSCTGWTWEGVKVTGGKRSGECKNVPKPAVC